MSLNVVSQTTTQVQDMNTIMSKVLSPLMNTNIGGTNINTIISYNSSIQNGTWSGINYDDRSRGPWDPTKHTDRLFLMAVAYAKPNAIPSLYHSTVLLSNLTAGLNFYVNRYCLSCPQSNNWWFKYIAGPTSLSNTLVVLKNAGVTDAVLKPFVNFLQYWPALVYGHGANAVWISQVNINKGLLEGNYARVNSAFHDISAEIRVLNAGDTVGIRSDWSFHEHDRQEYSFGYGMSYVNDAIKTMQFAYGTSFYTNNYTASQLAILANLVYEGHRWFGYRKSCDFGTNGRAITRKGNIYNMGLGLLNNLISFDPANTSKYQEYIDHINGLPFTTPGNKHFWKSDMMVHRGGDYYLSAKVISNRTVGTEMGLNNEGLKNYNLPFGATNILTTGNEYKGIFPVWDWARIPGITAELDTVPYAYGTYYGSNSFAGGTTSHLGGALAFEINPAALKGRPRYLGPKAKKSYFFMGDAMFCMGAGINTSISPNPINTSVNQCNLNGTVTANNGTDEVLSLGTVRNYTNKDLRWVHHDNVAYIFPVGSNLTVQNITQSGNWYNIATSQANFPVTGDVFSIYFNHGVKPVNANYQYIVAPRLDVASVPAFSANHGFVVAQNDTNIQAVKNTRLNTFGAVFYHPGTVDMGGGMKISSNKPAIVFIERTTTGCNISLADPLYINNNSITLTVSSAFKGVAVTTTTSVITTKMPTTSGDSVGSSVIKFYPYLIAPAIVTTTISGPSIACSGTNIICQASTGAGILGYTWSVPPGFTVISGQGTRTISLHVGTASGTIGVMPVVNSNTIPMGDIQSIVINNVPNAPSSILGNATVCSGSINSYRLATVSGATSYSWRFIPTNAVLLSGQNTSQISLQLGTASGILTVKTINACGTSGGTNANIQVSPIPVSNASITASSISVCSGTGVTFTALGVNLGTSPMVTWYKNGVSVGMGAKITITPSQGDIINAQMGASGTLPTCLLPITVTSNSILSSVNPLITPMASINASSLSLCSGSGIRLTAAGVNLGPNPIYSWFVNGTILGSGPMLSYVPKDNDFVKLVATASGVACLTSRNAQSSQIINVNPNLSPSLSINASSNPICSGTGVTFSAIPINLGTTNIYKWYVNGAVRTSTSASFTYFPSNNDIVIATANAGGTLPLCLAQLTATSSGIRAIVNATIPTSVAISASSANVCLGQSVLFASTASGTGSNPIFNWLVNNNLLQTGTSSSFAYLPIEGDVVKVKMTPGGLGTACITGGATTSLGISMTVTNAVTSSVSIASSVNTVCSGSSVTFTATSLNSGSSPTYRWLVNGQLGGVGKKYTYAPSDGDVLKVEMNVGTGAACVVNTVSTSNGISLIVMPIQIPDIVYVANKSRVCSGEIVSMTATGLFSGSNPTYSWWVNGQKIATGNSYSYVPSDKDQVLAVVSVGGSNSACMTYNSATSDGISFQVTPLVYPSITIVGDNNSICSGLGVSFTSIIADAGSSPLVNWLVNNQIKAVGEIFDYFPSKFDMVEAVLYTNGGEVNCSARSSATSNGIAMDVISLQNPMVTISEPLGTICDGRTISLQANVVNSGQFPVVQWFVNDTLASQGNIFSFIPSNRDQVYAFLMVDTAGYPCYTRTDMASNILDLNVVETVFPSVDIQASLDSVCSGTGIVFTATGMNGGSLPRYYWLVNGDSVATGNQFSYTPADQDQVNAVLTFGGAGVTCTDTMPVSSSPQVVSVLPIGISPCSLPEIGSISGPSMVALNANPVTYSVSTGADVYSWKVPEGVIIINGQGTHSITVSFGSTVNGFITVTASNANGSVSDSLQIQTSTLTELGNRESEIGVHLFPNPSSESFNIEMNVKFMDTYSLEIMDLNGISLQYIHVNNTHLVQTIGESLPAGIYSVVVSAGGLKKVIKAVKIK